MLTNVAFHKPTHSFRCLKCGAVTPIPRRVLFNPEVFAALHERLEYEHRNGCASAVVEALRLPETDWRIDIKPLGVAQ